MTRLSYVVPADGWDVVSELAEALDRQTAAAEIELVLVAPRPFEAHRAREITVRVVVAPEGGAYARATGVRASGGRSSHSVRPTSSRSRSGPANASQLTNAAPTSFCRS